jgi:hypothetical protein
MQQIHHESAFVCVFVVLRSNSGHGLLVRDAPDSVGLLWTSDQPDAETSTWQHTTLKRDKHPSPGGFGTHDPSKRAVADPCLRPRGHWDRPRECLLKYYVNVLAVFVTSYTILYEMCCLVVEDKRLRDKVTVFGEFEIVVTCAIRR